MFDTRFRRPILWGFWAVLCAVVPVSVCLSQAKYEAGDLDTSLTLFRPGFGFQSFLMISYYALFSFYFAEFFRVASWRLKSFAQNLATDQEGAVEKERKEMNILRPMIKKVCLQFILPWSRLCTTTH